MAAPLLDLLHARAFRVLPGAAYNQYRQEEAQASSQPLFFEASLPLLAPERALADQVMPTLARYLDGKSQSVEDPRNVVAAIFFKDRCYLLRGADLVSLFCEVEDLNRSALHFRVLRWLNPS